MKKIKLTKDQRITLLGLRAVYQENFKICQAAERAAAKIVGEDPEDPSRSSEFLWEDQSFSRLEHLLNWDRQREEDAKKKGNK